MIATKALVFVSALFAGARALSVSTPANAVQCGDIAIETHDYTGGSYHLSVVPAENSCESDALFESEALTSPNFTWKAKLAPGTKVLVVVDDDSGAEAWSGEFTIGEGSAACLASSSSAASSTVKPSSSTAPSSSTRTGLVVNSKPSAVSTDDTPVNAADDNTPATGAAFTNAQASLVTILAAMGAVAMAL